MWKSHILFFSACMLCLSACMCVWVRKANSIQSIYEGPSIGWIVVFHIMVRLTLSRPAPCLRHNREAIERVEDAECHRMLKAHAKSSDDNENDMFASQPANIYAHGGPNRWIAVARYKKKMFREQNMNVNRQQSNYRACCGIEKTLSRTVQCIYEWQ